MANEEFDFNLCIKEVAEQMVENPCYENFLHVIAELIIALRKEALKIVFDNAKGSISHAC